MSHPIALPAAVPHAQDYNMDPGSYTGENGHFNPASYTRHFLGSPISWRAGSFGAQYCTSQSPTAMLVGSYDPVKSPQDSSIINAWNVFDRQGELCRNYTCCGAHLPDLHALLEHFEEVHIVVVDRSQPPQIQIPFNPQINPPESVPSTPQQLPTHQPQYATPFDTDDMDLGDYSDSSPPPPSTAPTSTVTSRAPSPSPGAGVGFPFREGIHTPLSARAPAPFSAYARFNAEYNSPSVTPQDVAEYSPDSSTVTPALVFATGEELQGKTTQPANLWHSLRLRPPPPPVSPPPPAPIPPLSPQHTRTLPRPNPAPAAGPSILLPHKPFRCPKPNCSKSYKQANGLKYHMTHGSCNYGPAKDLEAVRALLDRKRANAAAAAAASAASTPAPTEDDDDDSPLSQAELNEVEARVRPFACGVGDCARRYKNMNGLRYHYQHSGDHGAVGLGLLAGGVHGCLRANANPAPAKAAATTRVTPPPTSAPAQTQQTYAWGSTLLPHIQACCRSQYHGCGGYAGCLRRHLLAAAANPDYLAQMHRAQYAQYQQAVAAGWYAQAQAPQPQVDVQMG
ncbi:hypothetical protein C8J57DRAFT_1712264 [Mycena rebaudengoi]|nr:hypothetical protein C8J57DRAFT_1712264 [Mycena rebaudengoi]